MGPLVSEEQFKRVTSYITSGIEQGAEFPVGGKKGSENGGYFVPPTVLTETRPAMKVVREEISRPVVCALPITGDDLDDIARQANSTSYGLAASMWISNISKANKIAKRIRITCRGSQRVLVNPASLEQESQVSDDVALCRGIAARSTALALDTPRNQIPLWRRRHGPVFALCGCGRFLGRFRSRRSSNEEDFYV
jgi:hypothetical protein